MQIKRIFPILHGLITAITLIALAVGLYAREPIPTIQPASDLSDLEQRLDASVQTITQITSTLTQLEDKLSRLESAQLRLSKPAPKLEFQTQAAVANADLEHAGQEDPFQPPQQGFDAERMPFAAESFDADWSLATEASVLTALTEFDILDIELDTAECYQSGCQLEFKHLNNENNELLIEQLQSSELFAGEFFARTIVDDGGATRTIMMVSRADDVIVADTAY